MNKELHKSVIEKQKNILDNKKNISASALKALDIKVALVDRSTMRKKIVSIMLSKADSLFTETSKLGKDFAEKKIAQH